MHTPSEDLRQLCKWFRVLTIGRGIAGKPTILERMTGRSRGQPEIRGKEGRLVLRASVISLILTVKAGLEVRQVNKCLHLFSHPLPKFKRGMSVIDYEITRVAHTLFFDSRGIEARVESDSHGTEAGEGHDSSKSCIEYIQKFINNRAQQTRTTVQLQAVTRAMP